MGKSLAAIALAVACASATADMPVRFTEWTKDGNGETRQVCQSSPDDEWLFLVLPDGRLVVELDLGAAGAQRLADGTGTALLRWVVGGVESEQTITTEYTNRDYYGHDHHTMLVDAASLREAAGADSATIQVDVDLSAQASYDTQAMSELFDQWFAHWCVDDDRDGYCDPTDVEGGSFVLPPMRAAEQKEMADCLNDHHFSSGGHVQRQEGQIVGAVDWAAESQWAAACAVPDDAPTLSAGGRKLRSRQVCETFWTAAYNDPAAAIYFCDGSLVTVLEDGTEVSGHLIRYRVEKARGDFPGFACPASTGTASSSMASQLPARKVRAPFSSSHQAGIKADMDRMR